jgi:putative DNA primase/helicase
MPLHTPGRDGCSCGVPNCKSPGKHPRTQNGSKDATLDKTIIKDWWRRWPDANVGIATGDGSGIVVLDIDPKNGGTDSLDKVLDEYGLLPDVPHSQTGLKGSHYVFRLPPGNDPGSPVGIFPGIDVRSTGTLIVAPPSLHASGRRYKWLRRPTKGEELPDPPEWLYKSSKARRAGPAIVEDEPIRAGNRRNVLLSLAGAMRRQGADEGAILAGLLDLNLRRCQPPMDEQDVRQLAANVVKSWAPETKYLSAEFSDIGNGERFAYRHGDDMRFTSTHGWLVWDGTRWANASHAELKRRAIDTVKAIPQEMAALDDDDDDGRKRIMKWYNASSSRTRIDSMLNLVSADERISVDTGLFDAKPDLFNCQNGTLEVSTGKLRPHNREDYLTKIAPVHFDPRARCPRIDAWLASQLSPEDVKVIYEFVGWLLVDDWRYKKMLFLLGPTDTGKSTLLRLIEGLLGAELVSHVSLQQIAHDRFAVANLFGKMANFCADLPSTYIQDSSNVKRATGGDIIPAERKFGQPFDFRNKARFIFSLNEMPNSRDKSDAWVGRHLILPFEKKVTPEMKADNPRFEEELHQELSGLLNQAVAGLRRLRAQDGFTRSASAEANRQNWLADLRPMFTYFKEEIELDAKGRIVKKVLYEKALQAVPLQKGTVMTQNEFNKQVRAFFKEAVTDKSSEGKRVKKDSLWAWKGIRFRDD